MLVPLSGVVLQVPAQGGGQSRAGLVLVQIATSGLGHDGMHVVIWVPEGSPQHIWPTGQSAESSHCA
jgi:hypothetical protein